MAQTGQGVRLSQPDLPDHYCLQCLFLQWLLICQLLRSQDSQREEHWLFLPALCCVRVNVIQGVELPTLQVFTEGQLQPHPRELPTPAAS